MYEFTLQWLVVPQKGFGMNRHYTISQCNNEEA